MARASSVGLAAAIAVLAAATPASRSAVRAPVLTLQVGDMAIAGSGMTFWRNEARVGPLKSSGVEVRGVAFYPGGQAGVVYVGLGSAFEVDYFNRSPDPAIYGNFRPDEVSDRLTALTTTSNGKIVMAVADRQSLYHFFVYTQDQRTGGVYFDTYYVTDAEVRDIDVGADNCTAFYATPTRVRRRDLCTGHSFPDVATGIAASSLRLLPDGTLLVALRDEIRLLSSTGTTLRTYRVAGQADWASVDLAVDGRSFWAATASGALYRFDLSGTVLRGPLATGQRVSALAVFGAPVGVAPPPPPSDAEQVFDLDGVVTLDGEELSGLSALPVNGAAGGTCSETGSRGVPFAASGQGVGAYEGPFAARGTFSTGTRAGAAVPPLGIPLRNLTQARGTFSIRSSRATITGTIRASSGAAVCAEFKDRVFPNGFFRPGTHVAGFAWRLQAPAAQYDAQMVARGRKYFDNGTAQISAARYDFKDARDPTAILGSGGRYTQIFRSSLIGVVDNFQRVREQRAHSIGVPRATTSLQISTRWRSRKDRFAIVGVKVRKGGRVIASVGARTLNIRTSRGPTSYTVTVSNPPPGRVQFKVKATEKGGGERTTTSVRRRGHRPRF